MAKTSNFRNSTQSYQLSIKLSIKVNHALIWSCILYLKYDSKLMSKKEIHPLTVVRHSEPIEK